jgi:hypothetical protein
MQSFSPGVEERQLDSQRGHNQSFRNRPLPRIIHQTGHSGLASVA